MTHTISLPELAPGMTHATLVQWMVKVGDTIRPGDTIAEIETDKAIAELEAEYGGVVTRLCVEEGTAEVPVNAPLLELSMDADQPEGDNAPAQTRKETSSRATISPPPSPAQETPVPPPVARPMSEPPANVETAAAPVSQRATDESSGLSPLASAIAAQLGDAGRSVEGRSVTQMLDALAPAPANKAPPKVTQAQKPGTSPTPTAAEVADFLSVPYSVRPLSKERRITAQRLTDAKRDAPHFYLSSDVTMDALYAARSAFNASKQSRLSVNDILVGLAARTLNDHPEVNVAWQTDGLVRYGRVDLAVAVATERGLLTPVVRDCANLSFAEVGQEVGRLAQLAHEGKLKPSDSMGAASTVSNLGMYGIREAIAVLNPPQSSILAFGAALDQPVAKEGKVEVAKKMRVTLSVDHRAVDGAPAARFLSALQAAIEAVQAGDL